MVQEEKKKEARKARFEGTSLPLKPLPGAKVATGGAEKKVEAKSSAPANAVKAKAAPVQGTEYAKLMAKTQLYKQQEAEAKAAAANGGAKRPAEAEDTEALKKVCVAACSRASVQGTLRVCLFPCLLSNMMYSPGKL